MARRLSDVDSVLTIVNETFTMILCNLTTYLILKKPRSCYGCIPIHCAAKHGARKCRPGKLGEIGSSIDRRSQPIFPVASLNLLSI